jgi:hypothetical protein
MRTPAPYLHRILFDSTQGCFFHGEVRPQAYGGAPTRDAICGLSNVGNGSLADPKVSSVLLSTQLQTAKDAKDNPRIRNGEQLVPNLTHIIGKDQKKMFYYYEVDDPVSAENVPDVRTSRAFYRGKVKVFETPVVERVQIDDAARKAAVFQLEVPSGALPPGSTPARSTSSTRSPASSPSALGVPAAVEQNPSSLLLRPCRALSDADSS